MNYGNRFKRFRTKVNLSQKDAAELLGIKAYQLGNYETNRCEPNINTLKKMSKIYRVPLDTLLGNQDTINSLDEDDFFDLEELDKILEELLGQIRLKRKKQI